jgi:hypothetical protein
MKLLYLLFLKIFTLLLFLTITQTNLLSQFICNPPTAIYLNHTSVDPPTFQWEPISGNPWWCDGVVGRYSYPCPYNGSWSVQLFAANLQDSCYTLPNSVWASLESNLEMCWALESGIGPLGAYPGGRYFKLIPALPYPLLTYPPAGATNVELTTILRCSRLDGATSYFFRIYDSRRLNNVIYEAYSNSDSLRIPAGWIQNSRTYWWRVKPYKEGGEGPISDPATFNTVEASELPPPSLVLPPFSSVGISTTPVIDWLDVPEAINYRLQISTVPDFSSIIIDNNTLSNSQFIVPSNLLNTNSIYYWRVATRGATSWSPFSIVWNFTTFAFPSQVVPAFPLNNSMNQQTDIILTWYRGTLNAAVDNVLGMKRDFSNKTSAKLISFSNNVSLQPIDRYWLEFTSDTTNLFGLIRDTILTDTLKTINGLTYTTNYYWRVKAHNEEGWGEFSPWWKFTTTNGAPVLQNPVNNQAEVPVIPLLNWGDVQGSQKFRIQVSAYSNFSTLWIDDSSSTLSQFQVSNGILAYNSLYYWRVKTRNVVGWGEYQTPIRFFTQVIPPPAVPVLNSPANGTTGVELTPLLNWNDVSGSTKYRVQVSQTSDFSTTLIDDSSFIISEYAVPSGLLNGDTEYFWRAAVKGISSWSSFSSAWNFRTVGVPQPVVLFSPLNNASNQQLDINFTWFKASEVVSPVFLKNKPENKTTERKNSNTEKISTAGVEIVNLYQFELTTDTLLLTGLVIDSTITDTTKSISSLNFNTSYFWRVKAKNEIGWGQFSPWWKFTTLNNVPPAAPLLLTPANMAANVVVTPLLDWSDVSDAIKYRLQISALSNFSVLWMDDSNLTSSSFQMKSGVLAYNSSYFWRVKTKNDAGWGNYQSSPYRFFTMIIPPPAAPVLSLPANGSTGVSLTPLFDWNDVSGAVKYRFILSVDTGFTNIVYSDSTLVNSQLNIPAGLLSLNSNYYWKAAAKNSLYWSAYSLRSTFKTLGNPQIVLLSQPANNSVEQPLSLMFTWQKAMESAKFTGKVANAKNEQILSKIFANSDEIKSISKYWFELSPDTVTLSGLISDTTLTDTLKAVTGLTANTQYYWRVKALNEAGWGEFSGWWKFTTVSGLPPTTPVLLYPANRAADIPVTPLLDWSDSPGAQNYMLQVSAFSNFSVLWVNDSSITSSEFQVPNGILAYNSGYFWRVKANNDAGWSNFQVTPFRFFTLVSPPQAPPALVAPANGALNVPLTVMLDWSDITSALKYRVQVSTVNTFVNNIIDDSSLSASQYTISTGVLGYNSSYYWRVAVRTGNVWSAYSNGWNFTTVTALNSPVLQSPINRDTGVVVSTLFKWTAVAGATGYRLQVSAFSNFSVLWVDKYISDTTYQTPNGVLAYNSRYFWKVKALRSADSSSYSNPFYFFTKIFPYNDNPGEIEKTKTLDLSGLINKDTKSAYTIEISKDTLFEDTVVKLENLKGENLELNLETLDDYSTYFWRIYYYDNKQQFSNINVFVTYAVPRSELMQLRNGTVIPDKYALYQNYPNPFNPECRIKFDIPKTGNLKTDFVKLVIYDLLGREVAILVNDNFVPGTYEIIWNAVNLPSGIYIYQLRTNIYTDTKKMVLLK